MLPEATDSFPRNVSVRVYWLSSRFCAPWPNPQDFSLAVGRTNKEGTGAMITCMGIESPGLTSSLAVAELVVDDLLCGRNVESR